MVLVHLRLRQANIDGTSTYTGPGLPPRATANARCIVHGTRSGCSTRTLHLVTGRAAPTPSCSWKAPMPTYAAGVPVATHTIGWQAEYASSSAEIVFVIPGLAWQTPTLPSTRASAIAMNAPDAS